jgi:hypothetical protein
LNTVIEQQDNEELAARRGEEQEGRTEKQERAEREADTGEWEGIEETQREVRDRAVLDTTTLHEPARFDRAAEVDEAFSLSPVVHNTPQPMSVDPAPVFPNNPVPGDVIVDPVRTTSANTPHCSPTAIPSTPSPSNDPATPTKPAITLITGKTIPHANEACAATLLTKTNTEGRSRGSGEPPPPMANLQTALSSSGDPVTPPQPDHAPKHAVTLPSSKVTSHTLTPATNMPITPSTPNPAPAALTLVDLNPSDETIGFIKIMPADPVPIDPASCDVAADSDYSAVSINLNPACIVSIERCAVTQGIHSELPVICANAIDITPTEPVHVDPVSDTSSICPALISVSHAHLLCKFRTCIKDMDTGFVEFHFLFFVFFCFHLPGVGEC